MPTTIPMTEAKTHLARLLNEVEQVGERIVITRSGRPAGVLLSVDEYEGLIETLEILADSELSASVRRGLRQVEAAELLDDAEVWDGLDTPLHP